MSSNNEFVVTAYDNQGLQVYCRFVTAPSGMVACAEAERELQRSNPKWAAIWAHYQGEPAAMRSTSYAVSR